ncbi:hypothetical protein [Legionella jordanis]|nr:hypothetical protein [Legionella jordanis]VEH13376.1 Uncharacterised protein [Legionella jordanis]
MKKVNSRNCNKDSDKAKKDLPKEELQKVSGGRLGRIPPAFTRKK